jgi:hypothetical protein
MKSTRKPWRSLFIGLCLGLVATRAASAPTAPPCWPSSVGGSGSATLSNSNPTGHWVGWWCPDGKPYGVAALRSYSIKHPPARTNIADTLAAYWALNVGEYVMAMRPLYSEMFFALPEIQPPQWTVAKNGSYPTRPAYPVAGGVVGTKEAARAPVGQPCDCSAPINRGSATYCAAPPPNAALVTVCRGP